MSTNNANGTASGGLRLTIRAIRHAINHANVTTALRDAAEEVIYGVTGATAARPLLAEAWRRTRADVPSIFAGHLTDVIQEEKEQQQEV